MSQTERLLWIDAPHFFAGAIWHHTGTEWACIEAAPIIRWMVGKSAADVARYLRTKGWQYGWL